MTEKNLFWDLLGKKLSGEASPGEIAELENLLKANPDFSYPAQNLSDIWALRPQTDTTKTEAAFEKHARLLQDFTPNPSQSITEHVFLKNRFIKPLRIGLATVCFFLVVIVASFLIRQGKATDEFSPVVHSTEMSTRQGSRSKLILPDSSVVWLNSGSRLTYDKNFGVTNRNTWLNGEAFFEVRKAPLPFTVQALSMHIKVMGTAFNVKAYTGEPVETSLIHGRVEVTLDKRPGERFYLKPSEKLVVAQSDENSAAGRKKEPIVVLKEITPLENGTALLETAWVENKLYFHEERLEDVARKMERWYNVQISIADSDLADLQVGGGPFENETVEQALQALQIAFDFRFTATGNRITITR